MCHRVHLQVFGLKFSFGLSPCQRCWISFSISVFTSLQEGYCADLVPFCTHFSVEEEVCIPNRYLSSLGLLYIVIPSRCIHLLVLWMIVDHTGLGILPSQAESL